MLRQTGNAFVRLAHAPATLESERLGDDADGEGTAFLGDLGDHRCRTGAGAATHAGCDEHQVCTLQCLLKVSTGLFRCFLTNARVAAGTQAAGQGLAELDSVLS